MAKKAKTAKTKIAKLRGARKTSRERLPHRIYGIASPHSVGGVSMFEAQDKITSQTARNFFSDEEIMPVRQPRHVRVVQT
jgi:hypothetical protein